MGSRAAQEALPQCVHSGRWGNLFLTDICHQRPPRARMAATRRNLYDVLEYRANGRGAAHRVGVQGVQPRA
eukprot:3991695-Heterocapsa_arctica.AAC.1